MRPSSAPSMKASGTFRRKTEPRILAVRCRTFAECFIHTPKPAGTINIGEGIVTTFAAAEAELVLNRADLPTITFKAGDVIRGNDLPGTPLWEVKTVNDRYSSIITLALNLR